MSLRALAAVSVAACTAGPPPARSPGTPIPTAAIARLSAPPAASGATALDLLVDSGGRPTATWIEPVGSGGVHRVRMSRLSAGRWSAPTTVAEGAGIVVNSADVPSVAEVEGGALVAHWAEASGAGYHVVLARSSDEGATWKRLGSPHADRSATEHGFASILPDGTVVWLDGRATAQGGATALRAARAGDSAADVSLDARVCDCCPTAAVMTERGPVVFYRDRLDGEVRDISAVRREGGRWSAPSVVSRDGWAIDACPVSGPAAAARGDRVAVAWHTEADGVARVLVAFSGDSGATFEPATELDRAAGTSAPRGRVSLALDDSGGALVTWVAGRGEDAVIVARRAAPGGALGPPRDLAALPAGRASGTPRIARVDGDLVVLWVDASGGKDASRLVAHAIPEREIGVTGAAFAGAGGRPATPPGPKPGATVGLRAPAVNGTGLDGQPATLASRHGKVVLVNVWATWCGPCRREFPILAELQRKHAGDGLEVIAVSVDVPEAEDRVRAYVAKHKLPFTVWLDPEEHAGEALEARNLPVTLLVDRAGVIRFRRDGALAEHDHELARALEEAIQRSGP